MLVGRWGLEQHSAHRVFPEKNTLLHLYAIFPFFDGLDIWADSSSYIEDTVHGLVFIQEELCPPGVEKGFDGGQHLG